MKKSLVSRDRVPLGHIFLFAWLPSFLKIWAYKTFLGYTIGRRVRLGFASFIVGKDVQVGDHVEVGPFSGIIARTLRVGRHSSIGAMSLLSCRTIEIGEDAKIKEQVFVGGPELPESLFRLGSRTVILQRTSINPTKPVVIGDDSGIGGHCLIFTHGSWLNALHGYPVNFEPVTIGKSVWLPWRVFVMPGATIGDGSVIGANSLVLGTIPPFSLAVGSPARVVKGPPGFPATISIEERVRIVDGILEEFVRFLLDQKVVVRMREKRIEITDKGRTLRILRIGPHETLPLNLLKDEAVLIEGTLAPTAFDSLRDRGIDWLDLAGVTRSELGNPATEELATFFGRYGIRFARDSKTSR